MFGPQGHVRPALEYSAHVLFVVLAAKAKEHARIPLCAHEGLKRPPWQIDANTFGPILAANARPQGLIAIQHDHLPGQAVEDMKLADNQSAESREKKRGIRNMPKFLRMRIVVVAYGVKRADIIRSHKINRVQRCNLRSKSLLHSGEDASALWIYVSAAGGGAKANQPGDSGAASGNF